MASDEHERILNDLYYNTDQSTAFASDAKLWQYIKNKKINVTRSQFKEWKRSQPVFSTHQKSNQKFKKIRIVTRGINSLWDCDLMVMNSFSKENDGINYILICLDVFSRFLRISKMKTKNAKESLEAIKDVISQAGTVVDTFRSDNGNTWFHLNLKF